MSGQSLGVFYVGDTLVIKAQLKKPTGQPEDLTGASIKFGLAETDSLDKPFITKTVGSGITVTDATNGRIEIRLEKGEVTKEGTLTYAVSATLANGDKYIYEQGRGTFKEAMF